MNHYAYKGMREKSFHKYKRWNKGSFPESAGDSGVVIGDRGVKVWERRTVRVF